MPTTYTITFDLPLMLAAGVTLAAGAIAIAAWRRAAGPVLARVLIGFALILLALAAGRPRVGSALEQRIAVMVDTSASTNGAIFREPEALRRRIAELLGDRPYVVTHLGTLEGRTTWVPPPPGAAGVLLFSDGRFEPPATAPPVFAVIDPALDEVSDAAVTSIAWRGEQLVITTSNDGPPREITVAGGNPATRLVAPSGRRALVVPADLAAPASTVRFTHSDAWPENDGLTILAPPPVNHQRWWIGDDAPVADWRVMNPAALPTDPAAYLAPSVIVLNNVAAPSLTTAQAQRLHEHVRDLGGGLLILGGDQSFAAGEYDGSLLGTLSPLASSPPKPAGHWSFLLDASGSMAGTFDRVATGEINGRTRFAAAVAAMRASIAQLPPSDLLSVGGFSDELRWWVRAQRVKDVALNDIPSPRGPTNLEAALRTLLASLDTGVANQVVLLTDGQAELPTVEPMAELFTAAGAKLHVFAIGSGRGLGALRKLAGATGGSVVEEPDVARWASSLAALLRQASPRYWMTMPVDVRFADSVDLPTLSTSSWNRTWLKNSAGELARTTAADAAPMAARMSFGSGKVAAVAFRPPDEHVAALTASVQLPPRDPRLTVTWRSDRELSVDVDAGTMNRFAPSLIVTGLSGSSRTYPIPQTGPGRYVLSIPALRETAYATLTESGRVIDRTAVPGRYAPEFDRIGNDREALAALAQRTGGRVIEPGERGVVRVPERGSGASIARHLAAVGALLVGVGLVTWRKTGSPKRLRHAET